ncbi:response regulator [Desulfonatronum sp. SC1]|uniref:response regulator n=1 Tax=Desulfonatronum sp. SC1 TaxID=2109626 RepID=UPI000D31CB77|nr:response regulator [Desulfonatronum sp. SC1]PTN31541.1 hypothetical protein C6366_18025 [Desulfonatronum sp. SC1]
MKGVRCTVPREGAVFDSIPGSVKSLTVGLVWLGFALSLFLGSIPGIAGVARAEQGAPRTFGYEMFDRHGAIMLLIDPESGAIRDANRAAAEFYGYPRALLRTMTIQDINASSPEEVRQEREAAARQDRNYFVFVHRLADGRVRTVEVTSWPIEFGDATVLFSIIQDVTDKIMLAAAMERRTKLFLWSLGLGICVLLGIIAVLVHVLKRRKQAVLALNAQARFLHTIINSLSYPFYVINAETYAIELANRAALPDGMPPEGLTCHRLTHMSDHPCSGSEHQCPMLIVKQTGKPTIVEHAHRDHKGVKRIVDVHAYPIFNEAGKVVQVIEYSLDVTDRRKIEEDLQRANGRLEEAMGQAKRMAMAAQAANVAKSQFLANMSHEIRTPMNGVIGMTGLLMDSNLTEEQRGYAEIIRTSGESLLSLINDILDFSKIEADKLDFQEVDFDLRAVVEDTFQVLGHKAHEKGLELVLRIDAETPTLLRGDPGRLRQILLNLCGNAIKFTADGEVVTEVALERTTEDGVLIRFAVRDTGIGIPEEKLAEIFAPFHQADASVSRNFGGTGLGLTISKRLVEMMGGSLGVESTEGQGSTFWFTAALGRQDREDGAAQPSLFGDMRDVRALIVDDNTTNRLVFWEQLSRWGLRCDEAEGAEDALSALRQAHAGGDPFRVALLDMQMPKMDGASLGMAIKADPDLRDTVLIMLTSLGAYAEAQRMAEIGFAAYLHKPVRQSQLFDCLQTVLTGPESGRPLQPARLTDPEPVGMAMEADRRRRARILLAEDNPVNQMVAVKILERLGYKPDVVANGREAVESLESRGYDLVLMDVQMPVMDGLEAAREIRRRETEAGAVNTGTPIIALTAHAMQGDRERCLQAGMNDYLSKPLQPVDLLQMLRKWLKRDNDETSGRASTPVPDTAPPGVDSDDPGASEDFGAAQADRSASVPVFDRANLMERIGDDEQVARQLAALLLTDVPRHLDELETALGDKNSATVREIAHTIKGVALNTGCLALGGLAKEVEDAAARGDLGRPGELMPDLWRGFDRLREVLREEFGETA